MFDRYRGDWDVFGLGCDWSAWVESHRNDADHNAIYWEDAAYM